MNSSFRYLGYVETNKLLKTTISILCILPLYKDGVSAFFNNSSLLESLSLNFAISSATKNGIYASNMCGRTKALYKRKMTFLVMRLLNLLKTLEMSNMKITISILKK